MRRPTGRILVVLIAATALVALAGCTPKPEPIRYDGDTGVSTSKAEWRVAAVTISKGPGIEVRFRNCSTVVISAASLSSDQQAHLRPVAHVTDSKGKVIFSNASPISEVRPAGSQVIDTTTSDTDDLQRIIIPTSAATGAIKVEPTCTTYQGYGSGPAYEWRVPPRPPRTRSRAPAADRRTGGPSGPLGGAALLEPGQRPGDREHDQGTQAHHGDRVLHARRVGQLDVAEILGDRVLAGAQRLRRAVGSRVGGVVGHVVSLCSVSSVGGMA